jgi:hypothetical protein
MSVCTSRASWMICWYGFPMRTAVLILRVLRPSGGISLSSCSVAAAVASCRLGWTWDLLQHVQQGELGVVLRCRRDRIVQSPFRILGEIRTEKNSGQVVGVGCTPFTGGDICAGSCGGRLTASTGQGARRITRSVTDPSIRRSYPRRPCVPMTITSASCACANDRMESAAIPWCTTSSG